MNLLITMHRLYDFLINQSEFQELKECEQNPQFHPEGDALTHTYKVKDCVLNAALKCELTESEAMHLIVVAMLHDLGKVPTKAWNEKKMQFTYYGHADESVPIAAQFLDHLRLEGVSTEDVLWLVANHMKCMDFKNMRKSKRDELLNHRLFPMLMKFHMYDSLGSNGDLSDYEEMWKAYEDYRTSLKFYPIDEESCPHITLRENVQ